MLNDTALATLFYDARTHNVWLDKPVSDQQLNQLYDLMKWGPTSANCSPARIVFVKSPEAKEKLVACMDPGNAEKTRAAPVTAIIGMDMEFYERLPQLFPHADAKVWFTSNPALAEETAFRNSSLQGAYLILAARSLGLDAGPMSGFDNGKVDSEFLTDRGWKSNFLINIGHGEPGAPHPRLPRLSFDEACLLQ